MFLTKPADNVDTFRRTRKYGHLEPNAQDSEDVKEFSLVLVSSLINDIVSDVDLPHLRVQTPPDSNKVF